MIFTKLRVREIDNDVPQGYVGITLGRRYLHKVARNIGSLCESSSISSSSPFELGDGL